MGEFKDLLTLNRVRDMINGDPTLSKLSYEDKEDTISFLLVLRDEVDLMVEAVRYAKYDWLRKLHMADWSRRFKMPQKYGHLANQVESAQNFTCAICNTSPVTWTWGDVHGEAMCVKCGTPYQLLQRDEEGNLLDLPPALNIKEEWVPVLKQYYQETGEFTGLAAIMIGRDYPECIEGQRKLDEWLDAHPELVP